MLKVNQYFDGNVASIGFQTATLPATVGVLKIGEYEFGTSQFETMTVVSGVIHAKLPDSSEWQVFKPYEQFTIEANKKFQVKVDVESAYLCTYEDK